jgi:hypothetical protein
MTEPVVTSPSSPGILIRVSTGIFCAILGLSIILALSIVFLPSNAFLAVSNYLQIITAIAGALVFVYLYYRYDRRDYLLYAAGAFALWGASNIVWYVNIILGRRNEVFPGLIDIGMIAAIFILSIAYQHAFPQKRISGMLLLSVLAVAILVPVAIILTNGITAQTAMTFLYFFACGSLIITGLIRSIRDYPLLLTGTLLFAIAFMIYPIRETFYLSSYYLSVIGVMVFAGFSLIVLGLIPVSWKTSTA